MLCRFLDFDECALGIHTCHEDAQCVNTQTHFECECKSGFWGNGYNCTGGNYWTFYSCFLLLVVVIFSVSMENLDRFHSVEVLFPEYSRVFLELYFHTTENISILWNWTKLWKLDFPTFFYNISILWKRSNFSDACVCVHHLVQGLDHQIYVKLFLCLKVFSIAQKTDFPVNSFR